MKAELYKIKRQEPKPRCGQKKAPFAAAGPGGCRRRPGGPPPRLEARAPYGPAGAPGRLPAPLRPSGHSYKQRPPPRPRRDARGRNGQTAAAPAAPLAPRRGPFPLPPPGASLRKREPPARAAHEPARGCRRSPAAPHSERGRHPLPPPGSDRPLTWHGLPGPTVPPAGRQRRGGGGGGGYAEETSSGPAPADHRAPERNQLPGRGCDRRARAQQLTPGAAAAAARARPAARRPPRARQRRRGPARGGRGWRRRTTARGVPRASPSEPAPRMCARR
ncbi:basic proline-rich protein-like [Caloenas nicobarica]|uniref:basic proline-rich protein-like n=1 Tax=Caloenas nicobarica TaxID=187106 RepID=UPI0032B858B8